MAETVKENPISIDDVAPKQRIKGTVKRTELYGAFVDVGLEADAILHISQIPGSRRIEDALKVGDEIELWVDKVDKERNQLILSMIEPLAVDWSDLEANKVFTGTVTRLEAFGAFVDIGAEKEGLVHVSEISHEYIRHPSQRVSVGDEIEVKVLTYSKRRRRINLSMKALQDAPNKEVEDYIEEVFELEEDDDMPTAMEIALRRAMGTPDKPLGKRGKKKRRGSRRHQQDDIVGRTLEYRR